MFLYQVEVVTFTERLWRSVKYEEVYLKDYRDVDTRAGRP